MSLSFLLTYSTSFLWWVVLFPPLTVYKLVVVLCIHLLITDDMYNTSLGLGVYTMVGYPGGLMTTVNIFLPPITPSIGGAGVIPDQ